MKYRCPGSSAKHEVKTDKAIQIELKANPKRRTGKSPDFAGDPANVPTATAGVGRPLPAVGCDSVAQHVVSVLT